MEEYCKGIWYPANSVNFAFNWMCKGCKGVVFIEKLYFKTSGEKLFKQPRLPEKTIPNSITLKVSK
jgi:hypothetical protein